MTTPVIAVRSGQFGYGTHVAAEADLVVTAGEVVALLGPNGSGKTTLLKGMLGLVDRLAGAVEIMGRPVDQVRDRSVVGYLPQRQSAAGPIPVTVQELVRSGRLRRYGLARRLSTLDTAAIDAAIAAVGLTDLARQPVSRLSGGQQRRALFARALAGGASLLLLDEPFAGVDQANQHAIADALAILIGAPMTNEGATVIVVLHELGPLEPLVTRAICMDGGRVLFDGAIADAPPLLLHLGHDHDPHGGPDPRHGIGLLG